MAKRKNKDISFEDLEALMNDDNFEQMMQEMMNERMKAFKKREVPEVRSIVNSLQSLTKNELEDIKYNLNVDVNTAGTKAKIAAAIAPYVQEFVKGWITSAVEDQTAMYDHFVEKGGISDAINSEDSRLDYLMGIGVLNCGTMGSDKEKLYWYMPDEILEIYKSIKNESFNDIVRNNDEIMRISAGLVHFYGGINYDDLFKKVKAYIDNDELEFADFMQTMLNGAMWYENVQAGPQDLFKMGVIDPQTLLKEQRKCELDYAEIPYDKAYDAGDPNYIESTPEFRAMAQFLMKEGKMDLMESAGVMRNVYFMTQNMADDTQTIEFLYDELSRRKVELTESFTQDLMNLLAAYNNTIPSWRFKGHSLAEIKAAKADK